MKYNSDINQRVKEKLVERDIYYCQTMVIEKLLKDNDNYFDLPNISYYIAEQSDGTYFEGDEEEKDDLKEELENKKDRFENALLKIEYFRDNLSDKDIDYYDILDEKADYLLDKLILMEKDIDNLEYADIEYKEVFEWWLISNYLANKLKGYCQVIFEDYGCTWWGRCTTGQAILLDHVISKIAEDMGILEGQENHKYWVK